MNRPITNEDFRLCKQRHIQIKLKLDIYDLHDNYVDTIVGGVVNGNASINADSDVRRTFSLTIIPDWKSRRFVDEQGYIWIDKMVHVSIGILDERTDEPYWWKFGKFIFTNTNTTYDATNNQLTINCSDLMSTLDGSKNGELGQLSILFPAYKEFRSDAEDIYYCKEATILNNTYKCSITGYNLYSNSDFIVAGLVGNCTDYPLLQINELPPLPIVDKDNRERVKASDIQSGKVYSFFIDTNTAVLALNTGYDATNYRKFIFDNVARYEISDHFGDFSIEYDSTLGPVGLITNLDDSGVYYFGDYPKIYLYSDGIESQYYPAFEQFCYQEKQGSKYVWKEDLRKITSKWSTYNNYAFAVTSLTDVLNYSTSTNLSEEEIQFYRDNISTFNDKCVVFFTNREYNEKTGLYSWALWYTGMGVGWKREDTISWRSGVNLSYTFSIKTWNQYYIPTAQVDHPIAKDCYQVILPGTFQYVSGCPISIKFGPFGGFVNLVDTYGNELSPSAISSGQATYIFCVNSDGRTAQKADIWPPDYDLPEGTPINYYTIRNAILTAVGQLAHIHKDECQVDDVGEYKALPIYNPEWEQYRIENPLWDNIPYDLEFAHGDTVLTILQKLRDLYPNYETYFDENGVFCCNMIPSGDEDPVIIPSDYYDDTIVSENTSMDLTTVRNICHAWGQNIDAKFYSENVVYNQTKGRDMTDCCKILLTSYNNYYHTWTGVVKNGTTTNNKYFYMPISTHNWYDPEGTFNYYFSYDSSGKLININKVPFTPPINTSSSSSGSSSGAEYDPSTGQIGGSMVSFSALYNPIGAAIPYEVFTITWEENGYVEKYINCINRTPLFEAGKTYMFSNSGGGAYVSEERFDPTTSYPNISAYRWKKTCPDFSYPFFDQYVNSFSEIEVRTEEYNSFTASIPSYDKYMTGDIIALKMPNFSGESLSEPRLNINGLGYVPIYDENTYLPLKAGRLKPQVTYCFKIKKKRIDGQDTVSAYLLGSWQVQGIAALVDTRCKTGINPTDNPEDYYTTTDGIQVVRYSEEYFKAIYACPEVRLIIAPDSPFTCQRIGEVMSVYVDETNLTSDTLASARADWEVYNKARLIDSISVTTKLSPFADVNIKVMYKRNDLGTVGYYIVKDVNHDLTNGTTTWQLMSFYPLYGSLNMTHGEIFENKYTHSQLSAYSHQNI